MERRRTALVEMLATGACPRGRFAVVGIGTRWIGVAWIGAPKPLRWMAMLLRTRRTQRVQWVGCGCVRVLKDAWSAVVDALT